MSARWNSADLEQKPPQAARSTSRPPKSPTAPIERNTAPENNELPKPHIGTPGGPCTWLLPGGQALSLAGPSLGPDRMRITVTGERNLKLLAALLEAAGLPTELGGKPC